MKTPKLADLNTPEIVACVKAALIARAHAETMRSQVDAIAKEILTECPIYEDDTTTPILSGDKLYLSSNEAACADFYAEASKRERAAGLKPDSMADEYCPALVAECIQRDAEKLLIETSGKPFGITHHGLLCAANGLQRLKDWRDLVIKLVLALHPEISSESILTA